MSRQIGRYKTPKEFKDEDIWFRWFTKKQFLYTQWTNWSNMSEEVKNKWL